MLGTDFSDGVKLQARRRAFFRCCYCFERPGDHVHHLIPKEEGGLGELDNAVLLCVQCHADYGHRPEKRAQLRQARDHWYEVVEKRHSPQIIKEVEGFDALRSDVQQMKLELRRLTETVIGNFEKGSTGASDVVSIASVMISSTARIYPPHLRVVTEPPDLPTQPEPPTMDWLPVTQTAGQHRRVPKVTNHGAGSTEPEDA